MASMPAPALQPRVDQLPPVDLDRMRTHAEDAATLLRSVGNPPRLLILCELVEAEAGVGELLQRLELSQSALSQHLAVLRAAGLVRARRDAAKAAVPRPGSHAST